MGNGCIKSYENMYFHCRKNAASYNDTLNSREGAADLLGLSPSSLADYELGITKVVPVDKVVLMADLYNAPELKTYYCKYQCPIGEGMPIGTKVHSLEHVVLNMLTVLDDDKIKHIKKKMVEIAKDGKVTDETTPELDQILQHFDKISEMISEMKLTCQKAQRNENL